MVSEIAASVGVTSRTYFRHYADKREVLFRGWDVLEKEALTALRQAPPDASPLAAVSVGLDALAAIIGAEPERARLRQQVIATSTELQEREHAKLSALGAALATGLEQRGTQRLDAVLAARWCVTVYTVAFEEWAASDGAESLGAWVREARRRSDRLRF